MSGNPCSFCQCSGSRGFLAFVGDKDECKKFCSERCLYKYKRVIYNKLPICEDRTKRKCSICNNENNPTIDYDWNEITIYFCNETCFTSFRKLSDIEAIRCSRCQHYFPAEVVDSSSALFYDHVEYTFCSNICQSLYVATNRKIVSYVWCKTNKYNFDMMRLSKDNATSDLCSLNCVKLFRTSSFEKKVCHLCCKHLEESYHVIRVDAAYHNFCSLDCVVSFRFRTRTSQQSDVDNNDRQHHQNVSVNPIRSKKGPQTRMVTFEDDTAQRVDVMQEKIDVEDSQITHKDYNQNRVKEEGKRSLKQDEGLRKKHMSVPSTFTKATDQMKETIDMETIVLSDEEDNPKDVKEEEIKNNQDEGLRHKPKPTCQMEETTNVKSIVLRDEENNSKHIKEEKTKKNQDEGLRHKPKPTCQMEETIVLSDEDNSNHVKKERKRSPKKDLKKHMSEPSTPLPPDIDAGLNLKVSTGVHAWNRWVATKRPVKIEILDLSSQELNSSLCQFLKEMKKYNGTECPPDTLYYLCLGIQCYLFKYDRPVNIFWDSDFKQFIETLNDLANKNFFNLYNDSEYFATRIEEEHLWESKQLGSHSPYALLNTLLYFNTKYHKLTTVQEHMTLSFAATRKIVTSKTRNCNSEVIYRISTLPKLKRWCEQQEDKNPLRCPVKLYVFYLSKCPTSVQARNDIFYLQPCVAEDPDVWYSSTKVPEETLEIMLNRIKMVKEICSLSFM